MANTYSKLYVHMIFAVKFRDRLIADSWKVDLYKYITGIITNKNQKLMIINGVADHVHLLIGFNTDCKLSDLARDVKANSSKWINENRFTKQEFNWQKGCGAFTVGYSQVQIVVKYILNQEEHHRKKSFKEEYLQLLTDNGIEYDEKYIFEDHGLVPPKVNST